MSDIFTSWRWQMPMILSLCALALYANGFYVFNYADGGYLWYGAWRTSLGEIPVLDFKSYDPGRYYWSAAFFELLGSHSLYVLKLSLYACYLASLMLLLSILHHRVSVGRLILIALVSTVWAFPEHKMFDVSVSLLSVTVLTMVLVSSSPHRWLAAGLWIGLVAFCGRNHLVYNLFAFAVAFFSVMVLGLERFRWSIVLQGLFGVAAGLVPFLSLALSVEGFIQAYLDNKIFNVLARDTANLALPLPDLSAVLSVFLRPGLSSAGDSIVALLTYLVPLLAVVMFSHRLLECRRRGRIEGSDAVVLAAALLSVAYYHHYLSRADFPHLAQAIHPFLVMLVVVMPSRWMLLVLLLTIFSVVPKRAIVVQAMYPQAFQGVELGGIEYTFPVSTTFVFDIDDYLAQRMEPADRVLALPNLPSLYVIRGQRAPLYSIYDVFATTGEYQRRSARMLREEGVCWLVFRDVAYDGRDERRYSVTNSILYDAVIADAETLTEIGGYRILRPAYCTMSTQLQNHWTIQARVP